MTRLNVLVLYGANATFTNTVMEHARSFSRFSRHNVRYASIAPYVEKVLAHLPRFDVAVLHYSFFPGLHWKVPPGLKKALAGFSGLKVLLLQDEYDHTAAAHAWIKALGIRTVYTCVSEASRDKIYPPERFAGVEFCPTLTGFVPLALPDVTLRPAAERRVVIGYRGRQLHPRYGDLAREKWLIGEHMREICMRRSIPVDIDSSESGRIYGRGWYEFLASCRATLGTESGANVLDADGTLRARIDAALAENPNLSYEEVHARFIGAHEGEIRMNQVSPRLFEAVAMRTALVLFDGEYSGTVRPWEHYFALRKDFGNADQVLDLLLDSTQVDALTARAYDHVIARGRFSYESFVREFDAHIEARAKASGQALPEVDPIEVPANAAAAPFMAVAPRVPTADPFDLRWLVPAERAASTALRRIRQAVMQTLRMGARR